MESSKRKTALTIGIVLLCIPLVIFGMLLYALGYSDPRAFEKRIAAMEQTHEVWQDVFEDYVFNNYDLLTECAEHFLILGNTRLSYANGAIFLNDETLYNIYGMVKEDERFEPYHKLFNRNSSLVYVVEHSSEFPNEVRFSISLPYEEQVGFTEIYLIYSQDETLVETWTHRAWSMTAPIDRYWFVGYAASDHIPE